MNPTILSLLIETLEEGRSSDIVHIDLACLQCLLKETPLENAMIVKQDKFLVVEWLNLYMPPQPANLANVMPTSVGSMLLWSAASGEMALEKDEGASSILQRMLRVVR